MRSASVNQKLHVLNDKIQACHKCKISQLCFNVKDTSKGYGKLLGWAGGDNTRFFFVGLNPSYRRFAGIEYAFGGRSFSEGTGVEFVRMLRDLSIISMSFVDNLCHCSTASNNVSQFNITNCSQFLLTEIKIVKPEVVIALGRDVYDAMTMLVDNRQLCVKKAWHPNFVFSYKRTLISQYQDQIMEAIGG